MESTWSHASVENPEFDLVDAYVLMLAFFFGVVVLGAMDSAYDIVVVLVALRGNRGVQRQTHSRGAPEGAGGLRMVSPKARTWGTASGWGLTGRPMGLRVVQKRACYWRVAIWRLSWGRSTQ